MMGVVTMPEEQSVAVKTEWSQGVGTILLGIEVRWKVRKSMK